MNKDDVFALVQVRADPEGPVGMVPARVRDCMVCRGQWSRNEYSGSDFICVYCYQKIRVEPLRSLIQEESLKSRRGHE